MPSEKLQVVLELVTGQFKKEAREASTATGQIGDSASTVGTRLKGMTLPLIAVGTGLAALAKAAGENADRLFDLEAQTGASIEQLQEYEFVAKAAGASQEFFSDSVKQVVKSLDAALAGTGAASKAYEQLGVSVTGANGQIRDAGDITEEVIAKLAGMSNITERNALAQDIFGKKWEETVSVLDLGTDAIERLKGEAHDMGAVMSEAALVGADRMRESFAKLQAAAGSKLTETLGLVAATVAFAFGDEASNDALRFSEAIKSINEQVEEGVDPLAAFANALFHAAEGGKVTTEELNQLASAAGFTLDAMNANELRAFALTLEDQARAAGLDEVAITRAGSAFRAMAGDVDAAGVGLGIYRDQAKGASDATDDLASALAAADDAELGMLRAQEKRAEAQQRLIDLTLSGTATADELRIAQLELNIATREAELATDAYNESLNELDGKQVNVQINTILTYQAMQQEAVEDIFAGGRQHGGPVQAGKAYIVGERGPEAYIPAQNGMILPNGWNRPNGAVINIHSPYNVGTMDLQLATILATVTTMVEVQN